MTHYSSSRKSTLDFVVEYKNQISAYLLTEDQAPGTYIFRTAEAFLKKAPQAEVYIVAPLNTPYRETKNIQVIPYGSLA